MPRIFEVIDDEVLREMNEAAASALTILAEAVEKLLLIGDLEATEVVGMMHDVARDLRGGA